MKKWLCVIVLVGFAACQKGVDLSDTDGTGISGGTTNSIVGTWKFISVSGNQQTLNEYAENDTDYKSVATSIFTTEDSTGTFTFNADSTYSADNVGYNLSYTTNIYDYANGVLTDSSQQPATFPLTASNSTGTYELIGSDSILFTSGNILSTNNTPIQANGGKYKINGSTLTLTEVMSQDTTSNIGGLPEHLIEGGTYIITLRKQ